MKLKNAGIKTVDEAVKRLIAGEVFYSPLDERLLYDPVNRVGRQASRLSPFQCINKYKEREAISMWWESVTDWQVEDRWEDNIGEGVLCWVSDNEEIPNNTNQIALITAYNSDACYKYRSRHVGWKFAVHVTDEEIKKYTLK